jgi:hypothetical protein
MAGSALSVSRGILRAGALAASLLSAVLAASPALATTFTVTNTADTGANSLRDALTLAQNCTGAPHTIAFNVPVGLLTGGVAIITPATALPAVTCLGTTIDGTTQTTNVGNTNNVTLGTGGTVGTGIDGRAGTGDEPALPQLNGPEVQITGNSSFAGLSIGANSVTIKGLAIYGFSNAIVVSNSGGALITGNVLGSTATTFANPGSPSTGENILGDTTATNTTVQGNLIGFAVGTGIGLLGAGSLITQNEIRSNGTTDVDDSIGAVVPPFTVNGNLIVGSGAMAIDSGGNGAISITNNTIQGGGFASTTERSGVYVSSTLGASIMFNIVSGNANAGVVPAGPGITIRQNSIFGNGTLGIDLSPSGVRNGDGVTTA